MGKENNRPAVLQKSYGMAQEMYLKLSKKSFIFTRVIWLSGNSIIGQLRVAIDFCGSAC